MLKAGFFEVDISPSVLMSNTSFDENSLIDVAAAPKLTASVWKSDKLKIAVIGMDTCIIHRNTWEKARKILKDDFGFDALLCAASHAHSGGPGLKDPVLPLEEVAKITDIKPELRDKIYRPRGDRYKDRVYVSEKINQLYLDFLVCRIVDAAVCAEKRLEEVKLLTGKDIVRDVGHNRRQKLKQGYTVSHAGKGNPDIIGNSGPIDDEVVALGAVNMKGQITGVLVNYGCHATVAGPKEGFSGDWPFHLRETIKKMISPETVTVFLNGCCGDVTQIDNLSMEPPRNGDKWSKILGQRVAFPVVDILCREDAHEFDILKFSTCDLPINWREISDEKYRKAIELLNNDENGCPECWFPVGVALYKKKMEKVPHATCNLNTVQIGNLVIATNPTETFTQTGMNIKKASPFEFTMTVELTNDWLGYMADADAFGPTGGGYEPQVKRGTCLEVDAAQKVTDKLTAMLKKFKPEKEIEKARVKKKAATNKNSPWHCPPQNL